MTLGAPTNAVYGIANSRSNEIALRELTGVVIWNNALQHGRGRTMAEPATKR
jgi:hypothetical protein